MAGKKKLLDTKGPFNGNVFKNLARYTVYITTNHVNFLLFDNDDMRPLKCQVSFILSIFCFNLNYDMIFLKIK